MKIISTEKIPIKMWLDDIEEGALEQAKNLANLPFVFKHIALMPDSHFGKGVAIGSVFATKGVVIPNAVGLDIGCGMCAVKTSLKNIDTPTLKKILSEMRKVIPVGFNKHDKMQGEELMPPLSKLYHCEPSDRDEFICHREYNNARKSLGTLGGGNHFEEIQIDSEGYIWIMIHSGSRNLGKQVAEHYNKIAVELNTKYHSSVDVKQGLAFLPLDTQEGQDYLVEMQYCVDYAFANRKLMMERIQNIFEQYINRSACTSELQWYGFGDIINIAHNYAKMENHFGENVMVHRKGATLATKNTVGIIPGCQGTKSYIVRGLGNPESFNSCSHGAGRKMGRKDAERRLNLEDEIKMLDDQGILHAIRGKSDLDEAPGAYKDISEVMNNQKDLVEILTELTPIAVIKG